MSFLASIASAFTSQSKRLARLGAAARGSVVGDLALWNQSARIGGGVTPDRISAILRAADSGDMRQLMDLANECRQRDAHLHAVLATHEETIASLPWQLVSSSPTNERAKDRRAREWCVNVLRATPALQRLLGHLAGAVYYSYAVSEIMWTKSDGRLVPTDFKPIAPRRFGFLLHDGSFVFREPWQSSTEGTDFRADNPYKFVVSQPRVTGDIANREGLCRPLVWMSVFRNWVIGDWLKTAEISWKPWRIGSFKAGVSDASNKEALEDIMRRLTTDGAAVIPDNCSIAVEWPGGAARSNSTHGEFVTMLGNEMSKATLGQTESTQSSASSGYAQAKVHDGVRKDLRDSRASQIASDITRDLVTALIQLNFGPDIAVPRFEFITDDAVDLKAFGEALLSLTEAGLDIPQKWARDQAGIPEPQGGESILERPEPVAPPGAPSGGPGGAGPEGEPGETPETPVAPGPEAEPTPAGEVAPKKKPKKAHEEFLRAVTEARAAGLDMTQDHVDALADLHDVIDPKVRALATPRAPTDVEKHEHASRMTAALIADIREARSLKLDVTQSFVDDLAARYGVPTLTLTQEAA
jgi:phage gp29-like protein